MNSKILIVGFLTVLLFSVSAAQLNDKTLEKAEKGFNEASIPEPLGAVIGDQTINAEIVKGNQTEQIGVKMDGVQIEDTTTGEFEDPTLEAEVDMEQVEEIASSEKPIKELNNRVQNNEIDYEAHGTVNSAKFFVAEKLLQLGSLI